MAGDSAPLFEPLVQAWGGARFHTHHPALRGVAPVHNQSLREGCRTNEEARANLVRDDLDPVVGKSGSSTCHRLPAAWKRLASIQVIARAEQDGHSEGHHPFDEVSFRCHWSVCRMLKWPTTRVDFWRAKIGCNRERNQITLKPGFPF